MAKRPNHRSQSIADPPRRYNSYRPRAVSGGPAKNAEPGVGFKPESRQRRILGRITGWILVILLIALLIVAIWDARNLSSASRNLFGSSNVFDLLGGDGVQTDSNGRLNVLLVGYSIDDPGHPAATLTDSIILLSMDRSAHKGYMLSIPRDLYVKIPGFGYGKINEAYKDGGMPLLENVVSTDFQTQINYYGLIDYAAVKDTVNALGGITVNINSGDPRGLFDPNISRTDGGPLKLSNGPQKIDGQTALNLTRARGDPCGCGQTAYGFPQSDFDRTQHQRQIMTAIKAKLNWSVILVPWKNQQILNALSSNIKTDIPAGAARSVFGAYNSIPNSDLQSISLRDFNGQNYLSGTYYEGDTLTPAAGLDDYSQIDAAIFQLNQQL